MVTIFYLFLRMEKKNVIVYKSSTLFIVTIVTDYLNREMLKMINISKILKATKPQSYFFKIESSDIELLTRCRGEIVITIKLKYSDIH